MKTINLYFDMEFTSLSPDAQPISLGIVSDEIPKPYSGQFPENEPKPKSFNFYAEFSDFDANRCDDWVLTNVVAKLKYRKYFKEAKSSPVFITKDATQIYSNTDIIKEKLKNYLNNFSDYQIQFVADCGVWDWWFMMQLLAEWEEIPYKVSIDAKDIPPGFTLEEYADQWRKDAMSLGVKDTLTSNNFQYVQIQENVRIGLPKLPDNISPVPFDLNDLIAIKKGVTPKEAFDMNREWLANDYTPNMEQNTVWAKDMVEAEENKHNALWDAEIIKEIYKNLNSTSH